MSLVEKENEERGQRSCHRKEKKGELRFVGFGDPKLPSQRYFLEESDSFVQRGILDKSNFKYLSPLRETADELLEYAVVNKYDDLVTVDSSGTRNGAVRVTKKEFVESGMMSRRVGSYLDDCTNIHSEEDLKQAEINIESKK